MKKSLFLASPSVGQSEAHVALSIRDYSAIGQEVSSINKSQFHLLLTMKSQEN
jgi:hypothetical protein